MCKPNLQVGRTVQTESADGPECANRICRWAAMYRPNQQVGRKLQDRIFVRTEYRLEGIELSEFLYIDGIGDYRRIITTTKKIMTLQSFGELSDLLPPDKFCRVHNSYILSIDKIERIERNRIRITDHIIPVSDSYSKDFCSKINK